MPNVDAEVSDYQALVSQKRIYVQLKDEITANFQPIKDFHDQILRRALDAIHPTNTSPAPRSTNGQGSRMSTTLRGSVLCAGAVVRCRSGLRFAVRSDGGATAQSSSATRVPPPLGRFRWSGCLAGSAASGRPRRPAPARTTVSCQGGVAPGGGRGAQHPAGSARAAGAGAAVRAAPTARPTVSASQWNRPHAPPVPAVRPAEGDQLPGAGGNQRRPAYKGTGGG